MFRITALALTLGLFTAAIAAPVTHAAAPTPVRPVAIKNYKFVPKVMTIKTGTTIVWANFDPTAHTVTADKNSDFDVSSGDIAQGKRFHYTFKTAGTFKYHCVYHPLMTGMIKVKK